MTVVRIPDLRSFLPDGHPSGLTLVAAGLISLAAGIVGGLLVFNDGPEARPTMVMPVDSAAAATSSAPAPTSAPKPTAPAPKKKEAPDPTENEPEETAKPPKKADTGATKTSTTPEQPKPSAAKPFLIRNAGSGLCVDLPGYDAASSVVVTQFTCRDGNSDNQQYTLANSGGGQFMLRNVKNELCLDVSGYEAREPGAEILIFSCKVVPAEDNLMFRSVQAEGGVNLVNVKSNLCLDVSDREGTRNDLDQKLWLAECNDSASQVWSFVQDRP